MTHLLTEPLFGDLGVTYALRLLVGKRVVDFLFAITEAFPTIVGIRKLVFLLPHSEDRMIVSPFV